MDAGVFFDRAREAPIVPALSCARTARRAGKSGDALLAPRRPA